ncbi:hypothetical protein BDN71DRAFT_1403825 [Pleurotus eryngii]|uniref:Uncharacterized protein n=1 Tax=Pleurotus eryngii TaxID=5323 RepID=A0A9P5ZHX3_PLEER|nr:hypothetical protein BDN71DRAFT_1403825 [Pleurotus eryngii]
MTSPYRTDEYKAFRKGETWGLCITDAFRIRIGRAARGDESTAKAIIFVEKKYFDINQRKKDEKLEAQCKRKATDAINECSHKRIALTPGAANTNRATSSTSNLIVEGRLISSEIVDVEVDVEMVGAPRATAIHHLAATNVFPHSWSSSMVSQSRAVPCSSVKEYHLTPADLSLKAAITSWHEITAPIKLGKFTVAHYREEVFLHDTIIQCIVNCAHAGKIQTTEDLTRDTWWIPERIDEFGANIISLI